MIERLVTWKSPGIREYLSAFRLKVGVRDTGVPLQIPVTFMLWSFRTLPRLPLDQLLSCNDRTVKPRFLLLASDYSSAVLTGDTVKSCSQ